jgi:hypothetical protein
MNLDAYENMGNENYDFQDAETSIEVLTPSDIEDYINFYIESKEISPEQAEAIYQKVNQSGGGMSQGKLDRIIVKVTGNTKFSKKAGTVPYNVNPADQVEVKNETGGTEVTGTVTDVKEEVNPDGTTSPTVEMSDGKTYPADEHMIQKTMNKSAKLLELENMDFGDSEKLSKLAKLEADVLEVPELIITSAVQDSTEADAMISDNEANEVFDEPVVKRSAIKPKVGSGFTVNTHGSLKANSGAMTLETMWND